MTDDSLRKAGISALLSPFYIKPDDVTRIADVMLTDFKVGLTDGCPHSSSAMLPTFLPALPDGKESGRYLSMDVSGTNVKILLLSLTPGSLRPEVLKRNFPLTNNLMTGTGEQLFDFLASSLARFLSEHSLMDADLPLGFVFSYPCLATSIRSATLLWWTKGFSASDVIGSDVCQLLQDAIARRGDIKVRVCAMMNDTVAQLAAAAYEHGEATLAAVVVGNGCNASYMESLGNFAKFKSEAYGYSQMVVDCEWEEFGNKGQLDFVLTAFDREIDHASVHRGRQIVDKLTGAYYLGELARRIMDQLVVDGILFGGTGSDDLSLSGKFPSKYVAEILMDTIPSPDKMDTADASGDGQASLSHYTNTRRILDELHIEQHRTADYQVMTEICTAITYRSAAIVAGAITALLRLMNRESVQIGIGGTLYQYHPSYKRVLEGILHQVVPSASQWKLVDIHEGSGRGAALVAAVVEKMKL